MCDWGLVRFDFSSVPQSFGSYVLVLELFPLGEEMDSPYTDTHSTHGRGSECETKVEDEKE